MPAGRGSGGLRQQQRPMIWLIAITACYVAVATSKIFLSILLLALTVN